MEAPNLVVSYILVYCISVCLSDLVKPITIVDSILDPDYDVVVFINDNLEVEQDHPEIYSAFLQYKPLNRHVGRISQFIPFLAAPGKSLIFCPTRSLVSDTSDSRQVYRAAQYAFQLMKGMGKRKPLLVLGPLKTGIGRGHKWLQEPYVTITAILGAFQEIYTPLTIRQVKKTSKYDAFGVLRTARNSEKLNEIVKIVQAVEEGRMITRDICGTDQERMTAIKVANYIQEHFATSGLITKVEEITVEKWPTMAAVNRNNVGTIYDGRVITMEYKSDSAAVETELYLVGKGIIFDTGGLSLKIWGYMSFMHSDKCGAAGVTGFMKVVSLLKPTKINVHAKMAYVRNDIGSDAYAVDEIIPSKAGVRSRIGNTDAEGRNVMVDLITDCIFDISNSSDTHYTKAQIITIATLTGHVGMAFGKMTAVMDNGPARQANESYIFQSKGALIGDMTEVSTLRREDYENCYPVTEYEDLQQRNTHPNTIINRGHQYPAAWMIMASGLDKHSLSAAIEQQIKYTHMDVASSVGVSGYAMPTGTPVPLLVSKYLLPESFP